MLGGLNWGARRCRLRVNGGAGGDGPAVRLSGIACYGLLPLLGPNAALLPLARPSPLAFGGDLGRCKQRGGRQGPSGPARPTPAAFWRRAGCDRTFCPTCVSGGGPLSLLPGWSRACVSPFEALRPPNCCWVGCAPVVPDCRLACNASAGLFSAGKHAAGPGPSSTKQGPMAGCRQQALHPPAPGLTAAVARRSKVHEG